MQKIKAQFLGMLAKEKSFLTCLYNGVHLIFVWLFPS
jgi:hypothetical protein